MTTRDPQTCRRALREIGEIAAVAILPDSQMSDQEALRSMAAIAQWVRDEGAAGRASVGCGDVIRRLNDRLAREDLTALEDQEALSLFAEVIGLLETSEAFEV